MKKILASLLLLSFFVQDGAAQTGTVRQRGIGVSLILNDFTTASRIRNASLSAVLRDKKVAKFKEMSPGLAVTYFKGFTPHIDFAASLGGSFVNISLPGKTFYQDYLLLEADASAHFKMLSEGAKLNLYLIGGIGASRYKNIYGAFTPLGGGIKVNVSNETQIFIQLQYRVPITTEANSYHFQSSIGVSGLLGKKRM